MDGIEPAVFAHLGKDGFTSKLVFLLTPNKRAQP